MSQESCSHHREIKLDQSSAPSNCSFCQSSSQVELENDKVSYETVEESAKFLLERTKIRPKIGIVCGSGLGHLADTLTNIDVFPYGDIPHFPVSTVASHASQMVFGLLNGVEVMVMKGRIHYYEGYSLVKCAMPIRVMKLCGCSHVILTNAAGGLNPNYKLGDIMIFKDHINIMGFAGNNPLQGPNDSRFGPRFPPMSQAYDRELIKVAQSLAADLKIDDLVHKGVYTELGGPSYETVAELSMWKMLGVDAVGMSTVHEVLTARHCDMKVFAFSLITNICVTDYETKAQANHEEVVNTGTKMSPVLTEFISRLVEKIHSY